MHAAPHLKIVFSQALQRSLEILQLPQVELAALLRDEIEKNPLLELESEGPTMRGASRSEIPEVEAPISLHEHLLSQVREAFEDPLEQKVGEELIHQLDERGFLVMPLSELSSQLNVSETHLVAILQTLQTLDPPGIFARNLQESFLLQLKRKQSFCLTHKLVDQAFDDLLQGRYSLVKKKLGVDGPELQQAIQQLARLSTRPAAAFQPVHPQPIVADLQFVKLEGKWVVAPIEDALPRFRLQTDYLQLQNLPSAHKETLRSFATSAKWLLRSVQRRRKLLVALGAHLVQAQAAFLNQRGPLIPIVATELAALLGVHESTISRALADKYVATPRGLIPLRTLVPSTSNMSAKEMLQRLITHEDRGSPLTDDELALCLKKAGHETARRTVAKYRGQLQIGSASTRKHLWQE
jgi:RNA polymerase sigma-54 factor